jgi:hypothetical protein
MDATPQGGWGRVEQVPPPRLLAQDAKRQDKIAAGEKFRASEDDHGKRAAEADAHGHAHGAGLSLDEIVTQDMIGAEENVHAPQGCTTGEACL